MVTSLATLDRKLWADLSRMKGQAIAICLVMACGVATFVMSLTLLESLETTRERYYRLDRFADVFVTLKRAPNQLATRLREVPGVAALQTRVVRGVLLDLPDMVEPASALLVSLSETPEADLNRLRLRVGRLPDASRRGEVVISELFAEAHQFQPGDAVSAIMNGKRERLDIVGIALSPEYVMAVQPSELLPDNRRFGVFWMAYRPLAAAFDMTGAFNDVALMLTPEASAQGVIHEVDRLTATYGGLGAYGREYQTSHRRLSDELLQLRSMALISPTIFLAVAAFLFNVVLSRIIRRQRERIATLKAFGYTAREIGWHYLKLTLLLAAMGNVLGVIGGAVLAQDLTRVYARFFRFPFLDFEVSAKGIVLAAAACVAAAVLGSFSAVRQAMRLPPAEAMRAEPPTSYRATLIERLGLGRLLSPVSLMVLRRVERQWRPTTLSVLGMAMAVAVLVLGTFVEDSVNFVLDEQFAAAQRQDVMVAFHEPTSARVLHEVAHLPGVVSVEPFRGVAARVRLGHRSRKMSILALEESSRLFRVLDDQQRAVALSGDGLLVSRKLAELLELRPGDMVEVEVLDGDRPIRFLPVTTIFPDYSEPGAYMNLGALRRFLREGECLSGAFLTVDARQMNGLYSALKNSPRVAGVTPKQAALDSIRRMMADNLLRMRTVNLVFSSVIALGVIYNCAHITLAERSRELASMRVMGFTRGEVATVLWGELTFVTLVAAPIGLVCGYGFAYLATLALDTETHRFPLVVRPSTFAYAAAVVIAIAILSAAIVRRVLDRLDLVAVLKVQE